MISPRQLAVLAAAGLVAGLFLARAGFDGHGTTHSHRLRSGASYSPRSAIGRSMLCPAFK